MLIFAGSTLNAFRLCISSVSAPIPLAHYSLTSPKPQCAFIRAASILIQLVYPGASSAHPSLAHDVYHEKIIGLFAIPVQALIPSLSLVPCAKYFSSESVLLVVSASLLAGWSAYHFTGAIDQHMIRPMVMLLKPKRTNWGARRGVFGTLVTLLCI